METSSSSRHTLATLVGAEGDGQFQVHDGQRLSFKRAKVLQIVFVVKAAKHPSRSYSRLPNIGERRNGG